MYIFKEEKQKIKKRDTFICNYYFFLFFFLLLEYMLSTPTCLLATCRQWHTSPHNTSSFRLFRYEFRIYNFFIRISNKYRFIYQYRYASLSKFPLIVPLLGIIHNLLGPNKYTYTRIFLKRLMSIDNLFLSAPINFLTPFYIFIYMWNNMWWINDEIYSYNDS